MSTPQTETTKPPRKGTKADLQNQVEELKHNQRQMMRVNSYLVRRAAIARGLGKSFSGERDMYEILGYPVDPDYTDFLNIYEREGIGTRLVDAPADETWRKHPILYVGDEAPNENDPGELQEKFNDFANEFDLWAAFNEMDSNCGISRYSLLLLGLPGDLESPAESGDLAFVTVNDEGNSSVDEQSIVREGDNPRFGLPEYYNIKVDDGSNSQRRVHYSRVLHYKEGRDRRSGLGRIYGVPRLKNVLNRLIDLEKVIGGGSEAFWLLIHRGLALMAKDGMTLPDPTTDAYKDMVDEIDEYQHGIRRIMRLTGMDVKDLGAEPVSSRDQFDVIIEYLAGSERVPQRILLGSERGELASSQDESSWNDYIDWRRRNKSEPYILRPFLKMAKELGFFDVPDNYDVFWPPLFQMSETQEASVTAQIANAVSVISAGAPETVYPAEEFVSRLPGRWRYVPTPEQSAKMEEDKRKPDEANQKPFDEKAAQDLMASFPEGGNGNLKERLNQILSSQNDIHGFLNMSQRPGETIHFIWHNFEGATGFETMIALRIPDVLRQELKSKYPWIQDDILEEMHITLCYLGDIRTLSRTKIDEAVRMFVANAEPTKVFMQGIARFVSDRDKDPIVATFDSPGNELIEMRRTLTEILKANGIPYHDDHGYIPHMTMAYIPKDADMPAETLEKIEMNFSSCIVRIGDEEFEYEFGKDETPFEDLGASISK